MARSSSPKERKLKSHVRGPDLADLAHQVLPGLQGQFSRLPARRGGFTLMCLHVMAGPDLADHLGHAAAHRRGQHLGVQGLDLLVFGGNCRQFRGSDEGEIPGIEIAHDPLAAIIRQLDALDLPLKIPFGFELRSGLADPYCHD